MTAQNGLPAQRGALRRVAIPAMAAKVRRARLNLGERFSPGLTMAVLLFILPVFAECFHYYSELLPLYALSKAWPILTLPLTIRGLAKLDLPCKYIYVIFLAYGLGVTPLVSIMQLGNDFFGSIATTVKIWPITYYFGLSVMLLWISPVPDRVRRACVVLGIATYVLMLMLWILIPDAWYTDNSSQGKLLLTDDERGNRIYMPMFFGILLVFYLTRSFMKKPHVVKAMGIVLAFALMLWIYKQRAAIGCSILICGYAAFSSLSPRWKRAALAGVLVLLPFAVIAAINLGGNAAQDLGGSLSVRQTSLAQAFGFLGDQPLRWLFGVGATTRFGTVTLADIFQNADFYVSDLGWAGVAFEYGLVGSLLIMTLFVTGFLAARTAAKRTGHCLDLALSDYILYMLATSAVYPLTFTPGELCVAMGLAIYMSRWKPPGEALAGGGGRRVAFRTHVVEIGGNRRRRQVAIGKLNG